MSAHTIAAYRHDLLVLAEFAGQRGLTAWTALDNSSIRTFAAAQHGAALSPRSIQRRLSAARTFYDFLMRESHCARNPALDVRNQTAKTAVELIESLFGKSTLMRKPIPAASDRAHALQWSGPAESSRLRESLRLVSTQDL